MKKSASKATRRVFFVFIFVVLSLAQVFPACANNLSVSNVALGTRDATNDTVIVQFDISWSNSWRNKINHDAVWVIVKGYTGSAYKHCNMKTAGTNPSGTSMGSDTGLQIYVPVDKVGAFISSSSYRAAGTSISSTSVQLKVDYNNCGFADTDAFTASVYGVEMVFVPQGAFYAGDYSGGTGVLKAGSSDSTPWYISSEGTISVTNPSTGGYRYTSAGNTSEDGTAATFTIPAVFPKGYNAFYAMKYELTEGEWYDFFSTLTTSQRTNRDITGSTTNTGHKNADTILARNTFCVASGTCTGGYGTTSISTMRPDRAMSCINWMDLAAYLDWAGLRPITELEFEKLARGPGVPVAGEYAWGTTDIIAAAAISITGSELGAETITTSGANCNYNNTTLTGGDAGYFANSNTGMLRSGIFATGTSTRVNSGAGYYGAMELSGNLIERVVTIGNSTGRQFTGNHGNGSLVDAPDIASGATVASIGNANVSNWPHTDTAASAKGVTKSDGGGTRAGSYTDTGVSNLAVSPRPVGAYIETYFVVFSDFGGRGVRTYDGN